MLQSDLFRELCSVIHNPQLNVGQFHFNGRRYYVTSHHIICIRSRQMSIHSSEFKLHLRFTGIRHFGPRLVSMVVIHAKVECGWATFYSENGSRSPL